MSAQVPDTGMLMETAVRQVDRLTRAVGRYRRFTILLGVVLVMVIGACITLGITVVQVGRQNDTLSRQNDALRTAGLQQCEAGNAYRMGDKAIWLKLFAISYAHYPPSAEVRKLDNEFLAYVSKVDATRNCQANYSEAAASS